VLRSGDRVVILEIIDNGCGIAPSDSGRLFDPFFTTKATGLGTGLGLSVARRIVELHGGQLSLRNRTRERGAIARVILPTKLGTGKVHTTLNEAKEIDRSGA
jgi:signal transduction histidine kinase